MREIILKQVGTLRDPVEQRRQIDKVAEEAGAEQDLIKSTGTLISAATGKDAYHLTLEQLLNMAGQVVNAYADMASGRKNHVQYQFSKRDVNHNSYRRKYYETKENIRS